MIPRLPHWVLTDKYPAFYDSESKTCIEMVAKIYAKMQELVDHYNEFVDPLNNEIAEYYKQLNAEYECFKASMIKIAHDYIMTIDEKIKMQDLVIKKYYEQFEYSLAQYKELVNKHLEEQDKEIKTDQKVASDLLQAGKITINHTYITTTKKVMLVISNGGVVYDEGNKQVNIIVRMEV